MRQLPFHRSSILDNYGEIDTKSFHLSKTEQRREKNRGIVVKDEDLKAQELHVIRLIGEPRFGHSRSSAT